MNLPPIDFSALVSQGDLPKPKVGKWTAYSIAVLLAPVFLFGAISLLIKKDILFVAYLIDSVLLMVGLSALIIRLLILHQRYTYETKTEFLFFSQANGWNYTVPQYYNPDNISPVPPELAIYNKPRSIIGTKFYPHFCIEGDVGNYHFRYTSATYQRRYFVWEESDEVRGYITMLYVETKDETPSRKPKRYRSYSVKQLSTSSWSMDVPFILKSQEEVEKFFRIAGLTATNNYAASNTAPHFGKKFFQYLIAVFCIAIIVAACIILPAVI